MPTALVTYCLQCSKIIKVKPAYLMMEADRCACDIPHPQFEGCKVVWDRPNAGPGRLMPKPRTNMTTKGTSDV